MVARRGSGGAARAPRLLSISRLARLHGLSRSTLLYYDRLGVLRASARSASGYRLYTEEDSQRLAHVVRFRKAGLPLAAIRGLLGSDRRGVATALAARLEQLNAEILRLREQQRFIVGLLGRRGRLEQTAFMSRQRFVAMLEAAGFTDDDMLRWHAAFEQRSPEEHRRFLEFLCIPEREIELIREAARAHAPALGKRARAK